MIRLSRHRKTQDAGDQRFVSSGKAVRFFYGTLVLGAVVMLAYLAAKPLIFLEGHATVEAPERVVSFSHIAEIETVAVRPAQAVRRGAVLAVLRRSDAEIVGRSLRQRLYDLEVRSSDLQNRLLIAREALGPAESRVNAARSTMIRIANADQRFISANFVSSMQREFSEASDRLAIITADARTLPSAIASVNEEIIGLRNDLKIIEQTWSRIQLRSTHDGIIGSDLALEGSTVLPGQKIMSIYDDHEKFLLWRLPSFSLVELEAGDTVNISYGRQKISGEVSRVLAISDETNSSGHMVEVKIKGNRRALPLGAVATISLSYFDRLWDH